VTGLSDKNMPSEDICHIIGPVHFYARWPLVHTAANVVKRDTSHVCHIYQSQECGLKEFHKFGLCDHSTVHGV